MYNHFRTINKNKINGSELMTKRQISFLMDKELVKEFEKIRDETGIPVSRQIELKLKGYKIVLCGDSL